MIMNYLLRSKDLYCDRVANISLLMNNLINGDMQYMR